MRCSNKLLFCILLFLSILSGCTPNDPGTIQVINEIYTYSVKSKNYVQPAAVDGWVEKSALTTETDDGKFYCFTDDKSIADDFINVQRTLVTHLRNCGVEIGEMEFYGTDYGYSFSESSKNGVYVALSDMRTWQQVLVTLQTVWGDYTDYGYIYAMSNAIADELEWQTDSVPTFEKNTADLFFAENPIVINLLYPTFTDKFASEKTINNSKALAIHLFEKIEWKNALKKPIVEQLDDYYKLVSTYAQTLSVPFERQICGYAYYGEGVKLRIMTTYAELIIEDDYTDIMSAIYDDYFGDYNAIFQTASTINKEITAAVECFGLEDNAGIVTIKWLDYRENYTARYTEGRNGIYYATTNTAYVTSINPYLHEYYHHIEHLINPSLGKTWQSQAFCEIGNANSYYVLYRMEKLFAEGKMAELFYSYTGRDYRATKDDYYEACDILCYMNNDYLIDYESSGPLNSFSKYMIDRYGENATYKLMLFPETVETVTGKNWQEWQTEWKQYIQQKYANVTLPHLD